MSKHGLATVGGNYGSQHAYVPPSTSVSLSDLTKTYPLYFIQPSLSQPERTLFAALAPSPQTAGVLKAACRTWADHLWAQIGIVCEEKESMELARLGLFWEGNGGGEFWSGKGGAIVSGRETDGEAEEREEEKEEREWEKEVVGALESLKMVQVADGWVSSHLSFDIPFNF